VREISGTELHRTWRSKAKLHGDAALSERHPHESSQLAVKGRGKPVLIMPTVDAANISFNLPRPAPAKASRFGPMLLGAAKPGSYPHAHRHRAAAVNMARLGAPATPPPRGPPPPPPTPPPPRPPPRSTPHSKQN